MNKDWLDISVLEDYLDGKLDGKAMNRVEREALEDPFVAEALDGLSRSPKRSLESISMLQKQLQERVAEQHRIKKASVITWQRLSVAAAAAVLFISVGIIFWMKQNNYQEMLAKRPKKVDVNLAPREFKDTLIQPGVELARAKTKEETLRKNAIERAIAVSKSKEALASIGKPRNRSITTAEPAPAAVSEPASALNEVTITAAPQARQSVAYSVTNLNNAEGTKMVSGRVIDVNTGEALANANIYAASTSNGPPKGIGTADQNGNFTVTVPAEVTDLMFSFTGYDAQKIKITGNTFDVALKETKNNLNDVVIRGYQKRSKEQVTGSSFTVSGKAVQDVPVANVEQLLQGKVAALNIQNNSGQPSGSRNSAQPSGGWDKFTTYLMKTNRFGTETAVGQSAEFKFSIRNGRPVNITVVNGVSKSYDEEAIRLIKNGPGWKLSDPAHPEVSVVLKF